MNKVMKTLRYILTATVFAAAATMVSAQDYPEEYLGLPGDNLNLYAVMNLFQQSETLEAFERSLNDEESRINNLDLNGDNFIDYISVSDYTEGNVHNIVLRTALDRNDQQDIAVFVVEKLRNGEVQIQLIGDEALYGPNYIVEPIYAETPNPGYTGNSYNRNVNVVTTTYYDIAAWPVIRYIYFPGYRPWRSAWYWGYYPSYWSPWRPYYWHYYYGYHYHHYDYYYRHYHHWNHYRCNAYNDYYRSHVRVYSPVVSVNVNKGAYRTTYSRPDQRQAGEELYTRTAANKTYSTTKPANAERTTTVGTRQEVQRAASQPGATRSTVSSSARSEGAARTAPAQRSSSGTTGTVRSSQPNNGSAVRSSSPSSGSRSSSGVQRSSGSGERSAVQRSSQGDNRPAVQSSSSRSSSSSAPARSPQSGSRSSVSQSSGKSSSPAVRSSSPSRSSSPAVKSSSSSGRSSSPAVKSSSSGRSSSSSVKSSSPSRGSSHSSSGKSSSSRSAGSGQRSTSSSSRR